MAKNVKSIKSTKQTNTAKAGEQHAFRVVLRGTVMKGKKEVRVRHVFTTKARNEGDAVEAAQPNIQAVIKKEGLRNEYLNVFAPLVKAA